MPRRRVWVVDKKQDDKVQEQYSQWQRNRLRYDDVMQFGLAIIITQHKIPPTLLPSVLFMFALTLPHSFPSPWSNSSGYMLVGGSLLTNTSTEVWIYHRRIRRRVSAEKNHYPQFSCATALMELKWHIPLGFLLANPVSVVDEQEVGEKEEFQTVSFFFFRNQNNLILLFLQVDLWGRVGMEMFWTKTFGGHSCRAFSYSWVEWLICI